MAEVFGLQYSVEVILTIPVLEEVILEEVVLVLIGVEVIVVTQVVTVLAQAIRHAVVGIVLALPQVVQVVPVDHPVEVLVAVAEEIKR